MKPRNILVNSNFDLRICDFGLARVIENQGQKKANDLTDYVITRWYRPPELLLESHNYTDAVDMWSVGIIFGEMLLKKHFLQGNSSAEQL